jgi:hypothetical protein
VKCCLYISNIDQVEYLKLDLTGDCVELPQPNQLIEFRCAVRSSSQHTIEVENRLVNIIMYYLVIIHMTIYFVLFDCCGVVSVKNFSCFLTSPVIISLVLKPFLFLVEVPSTMLSLILL